MRLLIFWDSIWEWFYDTELWGWVNRLKIKLWENDIDVSNCAISAYTSRDVLNIFEPFFNAYSNRAEWKEKETIVIFAIWTNDSSFRGGGYYVEKDEFKWNLIKLASICRNNSLIKKLFFLTSINCDETKTTPTPWAEAYYRNIDIERYNQVIKEVSKENNLEYLDLFWVIDNSELPDWLHPDANWHKKIYDKVYDFLKNNI